MLLPGAAASFIDSSVALTVVAGRPPDPGHRPGGPRRALGEGASPGGPENDSARSEARPRRPRSPAPVLEVAERSPAIFHYEGARRDGPGQVVPLHRARDTAPPGAGA